MDYLLFKSLHGVGSFALFASLGATMLRACSKNPLRAAWYLTGFHPSGRLRDAEKAPHGPILVESENRDRALHRARSGALGKKKCCHPLLS
jgi:hypothetical protein